MKTTDVRSGSDRVDFQKLSRQRKTGGRFREKPGENYRRQLVRGNRARFQHVPRRTLEFRQRLFLQFFSAPAAGRETLVQTVVPRRTRPNTFR